MALSRAFFIQVSSAPRRVSPLPWIAKSMSVVVPPQAAARVPVSKSSELVVPPNGMSRCVWTSMPPGKTYLPLASIVFLARSRGNLSPMATILPPSMPTSAWVVSLAVTTVPFTMSASKAIPFTSNEDSDGVRGFPRAVALHIGACRPHYEPEHINVIHESGQRNPVGDRVDRADEVSDCAHDQHNRTPWHLFVPAGDPRAQQPKERRKLVPDLGQQAFFFLRFRHRARQRGRHGALVGGGGGCAGRKPP